PTRPSKPVAIDRWITCAIMVGPQRSSRFGLCSARFQGATASSSRYIKDEPGVSSDSKPPRRQHTHLTSWRRGGRLSKREIAAELHELAVTSPYSSSSGLPAERRSQSRQSQLTSNWFISRRRGSHSASNAVKCVKSSGTIHALMLPLASRG